MEGEDRPGLGDDVVWGRPEDESPLRLPSDAGATLPGPSGLKAAGLRGERRWGRPAPATPIGDPARLERAEIGTPRWHPAASPGWGTGGRLGGAWACGPGKRLASGNLTGRLTVSCARARPCVAGRLALARVTPPRCLVRPCDLAGRRSGLARQAGPSKLFGSKLCGSCGADA